MKCKMASIILSLTLTAGMAQHSKTVDTKVTGVTVFLNKAQVTRSLKTNLEKGKTELVVSGLSSQLDPESIQVSGKGNVVILGINHQQNYLNEFELPKPLRILKDSLEYFQRNLILEQGQKEILNKEEQMLLSNQKIGGANQNITVSELKAMADFYRSRLNEIVASRLKQDEKIKKINESIARLLRQIKDQSDLRNRNTSEIVVSVSAEASTSIDLTVNYVVNNAGWYPVYDLRAANTKSPIQISYKANVFQRTGEEWKNVKLKLSTANPNLGGLKPELYTWYLDFYNPVVYRSQGKRELNAPASSKILQDDGAGELAHEAEAANMSDYVSTVQTSLNTEFEISLPYSIASSAKPTVVDIRDYDLKATYSYSVVPKLEPDAFLIAKATGWESLSLLPGEANIFFEGTFVGKTFIDPNNIQDTLSLSLGRDQRIVVKREKLKELTTKRLIGSNIREQFSWEISVRNTKSEPIVIKIEDQIPIPKNNQIELGLVDVGGAQTEPNTGKITWVLNIAANETKKVTFKYEVKYPKDKKITGL